MSKPQQTDPGKPPPAEDDRSLMDRLFRRLRGDGASRQAPGSGQPARPPLDLTELEKRLQALRLPAVPIPGLPALPSARVGDLEAILRIAASTSGAVGPPLPFVTSGAREEFAKMLLGESNFASTDGEPPPKSPPPADDDASRAAARLHADRLGSALAELCGEEPFAQPSPTPSPPTSASVRAWDAVFKAACELTDVSRQWAFDVRDCHFCRGVVVGRPSSTGGAGSFEFRHDADCPLAAVDAKLEELGFDSVAAAYQALESADEAGFEREALDLERAFVRSARVCGRCGSLFQSLGAKNCAPKDDFRLPTCSQCDPFFDDPAHPWPSSLVLVAESQAVARPPLRVGAPAQSGQTGPGPTSPAASPPSHPNSVEGGAQPDPAAPGHFAHPPRQSKHLTTDRGRCPSCGWRGPVGEAKGGNCPSCGHEAEAEFDNGLSLKLATFYRG